MFFYAMNQPDSSFLYLNQSLLSAPASRSDSSLYSAYISVALDLSKTQEAARALTILSKICPTSPDIPRLRQRLQQRR